MVGCRKTKISAVQVSFRRRKLPGNKTENNSFQHDTNTKYSEDS